MWPTKNMAPFLDELLTSIEKMEANTNIRTDIMGNPIKMSVVLPNRSVTSGVTNPKAVFTAPKAMAKWIAEDDGSPLSIKSPEKKANAFMPERACATITKPQDRKALLLRGIDTTSQSRM